MSTSLTTAVESSTLGAPKKSCTATIAAAVILFASLALLSFALRGDAAHRDFISYWSTAKLLTRHQNPYDSVAILKIENGAGSSFSEPFIMRNPPWTLFMVAPLGWFSAPVAALIWTIAIMLAALVSVRLLQIDTSRPIPLTVFLFAPLLACAMAGQSAIFLLLGAALFLRLEQRRSFAAGLALTLLFLKPHLLLCVLPVLFFDCLRRRRFGILAGAVVGLLAATGLALFSDRHLWSHYLIAMRSDHIEAQYLPNISCTLRALVAPNRLWLQAVPTLVCFIWACWFWMRHRHQWDWRRHGALLIAASVLTAPYSWPVDQVLFLPAIFSALLIASRKQALVLAAINILAALIMVGQPSLSSPLFLWMAPAWLLWCLWAGAGDNHVGSRDLAAQCA